MNQIRWGMIGCGDVTEMKSGPAFKLVQGSDLVAVMSRNSEKAQDYAFRHQVKSWYDNAFDLINDPEVNAIYIATPPSSHEDYCIASFDSGKPVYVEKPVSVNAASASRIAKAARDKVIKFSVAHYRRAQPLFKKLKELIDQKAIGDIRLVNLEFTKPVLTLEELEIPKISWRVDPVISGGGLFHDLAPHQLDLMIYFFGDYERASGVSANQAQMYPADDIVTGQIFFNSGVIFNGTWCFNAPLEKDHCEIIGSEGSISFSVFGNPEILITKQSRREIIKFEQLKHVQQPMIELVVNYFLSNGNNPCSGEEASIVMQLIDSFTTKI